MSYARFGWDGSDVYVIHHVDGYLRCYCRLPGNHAPLRSEMIAHLMGHRALGHTVPAEAIRELEVEIAHEGDYVGDGRHVGGPR